uniref:Uncharacterized protein n=1 Tax=Arundo donax TaxID=35708 RepID=A0A0A9DES7_ARUDO
MLLKALEKARLASDSSSSSTYSPLSDVHFIKKWSMQSLNSARNFLHTFCLLWLGGVGSRSRGSKRSQLSTRRWFPRRYRFKLRPRRR